MKQTGFKKMAGGPSFFFYTGIKGTQKLQTVILPIGNFPLKKKRGKDALLASQKSRQKRNLFPTYISLFIVAVGFFSYQYIPEVQHFTDDSIRVLVNNDREEIKTWIDNLSWAGPVILILAMVLQMFLVIVPTTLLLVVCILAYGPVWGGLIALVAIYAASTVGYFIGRHFGSLTAEWLIGERATIKVTGFLEKYGFWAIFITRLNPFLSNDAVSLASGVLKIRYWKFILASLTGIAPLILCMAVFGESRQGLEILFAGSILIVILLSMYVFFWKKILLRMTKRA